MPPQLRTEAVPTPDDLGAAIRARRTELRLSQEALGHRCELHRTYIAGVERGERNPSLKSISRIARALDIRVSELMARAEHHALAEHADDAQASGTG